MKSLSKSLFVVFIFVFLNTTLAFSSASVTLTWDPNDPTPEGYRVFAREDGDSYNYETPVWENSDTTCTLIGLTEGVTYHFVVRAYESELESVDSEEVSYTPPISDSNSGNSGDTGNDTDVDSDNDGVVDSEDAFPNDPDEWADNDNDGIGNNQDTDDDNDGMTDEWELANGSDPYTDDDELDADGDGISNMDEYLASTNGSSSSEGSAPQAPEIETVSTSDRVSLTPSLVCGQYFDADDDEHYQTRWQISTEESFSSLVLDAVSSTQLYTYAVGEMLLDADTAYYWRVQFIDAEEVSSDWSDVDTFTTLTTDSAGDADLDGVVDTQEVDESTDINTNGVADTLEAGIMTINTVEGEMVVGVETLSNAASLVSVKSIASETIADDSVSLGFGLIGFKLYLQDGETTASVKLHFEEEVPSDAKLYKYSTENGWEEYEYATFAADGKSVTLVLEDGGAGDEDGVVNGVIVDPSGVAYTDTTTDDDSASLATTNGAGADAGSGSCFISSCSDSLAGMNGQKTCCALLVIFLLAAVGLVAEKAVAFKK